ncbi:acyl transferase/acyl hydrolase/lysophospholipase [Achaetomium macrosporum]|uniref:Patatin-like phospholipase domain-containing protein n=1 Tax=Achaetomium macrosporum TaxID=79813 RepID=A0AAN7CFM0_9PEZI|nr:acyl transferase/acyl hydrolase/lysophospholipase [Achaetomium macrosporum]
MSDLLVHGAHHGPRITLVKSTGSSSTQPPSLEPLKIRTRRKSKSQVGYPLSRLVRGAGNLALSWRDGFSGSERAGKGREEGRRQILAARMQNATTLKEWEAAAAELDRLEGNNEWKLDDSSGEYDYRAEQIRAKLRDLDTARINCDISTMMYLIRTGLSRDVGGMGNLDLYRHSYVGTKKLIEQYVDSAIKTIQSVVEKSTYQTEMDLRELLEGMACARQSFGRSALLLSGGATFGMAHIGVLKTLYEQKLLPRIISGASAGSIVCSVLCTRKDDEIPALIKGFPFGDLSVFEGENEGISSHLRHLLTKGSWSDISNLTRVMRDWLGDVTFLEAYNRTRRICNICVSSSSVYEVPRLLNYITAPNVLIWSAVAASCSVPLVFQGHPLLMKNPVTGKHEPWIPTPQQFIDGSVDNDLPMTRLAEMFNVNHFIVSQVNPHVVPFLAKDDQPSPGQIRQQPSQTSRDWLWEVTAIAKEETLHRMHFLAELGFLPNVLTKLLSVLSQTYSGDITILPEVALHDLPLILKNPTPEFMLRNCLMGERATWPKLSRIRDRLAIELALDQAVHALRARVVFSKSQVNLRRAMGVWQPVAYNLSGGRGTGAESGDQNPPWAIRVQPPDSAGVTPTDDKTFGRRRGSGASIQLVVARHKKPFQEEDEQSEEDERLELKVRSRKKSNRPGGGPSKPRLKRNAKSHSHIRGLKPGDLQPVPRFALSPADFWRQDSQSGDVSTGEDSTHAEEGSEVARADTPSTGLEVLSPPEAEGVPQASDGGLRSDADPYAGSGIHGPGPFKNGSLSKLR